MNRGTQKIAAMALAFMTGAGSAVASEGAYEMNQVCAETTGCFPGDLPGFPVTINFSNTGESFVLTSNLTVSSLTQAMVVIQSSRVTLDLGGFALSNSTSTSGTADIVQGSLLGADAVIRNGSIRGGGGQGVDFSATAGTRVQDITFLNQGGGAISLGDDSFVRNNRVVASSVQSGDGIRVGDRSDVSGNTVEGSAADGIVTGDGSTVSRNTISQNGEDGISAGSGTNIFENTVFDNGDAGIRVSNSGRVSGNSIYSNGGDGIRASFSSLISDNLVASNDGAGIVAREAATIIGNSVALNQGNGLDLLSSVYRNNHIQSPIPGVDVVGGIDGGGNICNGTTSCP